MAQYGCYQEATQSTFLIHLTPTNQEGTTAVLEAVLTHQQEESYVQIKHCHATQDKQVH
jgi:hypothetical protein